MVSGAQMPRKSKWVIGITLLNKRMNTKPTSSQRIRQRKKILSVWVTCSKTSGHESKSFFQARITSQRTSWAGSRSTWMRILTQIFHQATYYTSPTRHSLISMRLIFLKAHLKTRRLWPILHSAFSITRSPGSTTSNVTRSDPLKSTNSSISAMKQRS